MYNTTGNKKQRNTLQFHIIGRYYDYRYFKRNYAK